MYLWGIYLSLPIVATKKKPFLMDIALLIQSKQQFFSNVYFSFQALVILGLCHYENAVFVCVILVTVFVVAYNV